MNEIQSRLLKILRKYRKNIRGFKGVHYADVGYKYKDGEMLEIPCIRFHVYQKHTASFLRQNVLPAEIDGVITDVIMSRPVLNSLQGVAFSTLAGGIEIENAHEVDSGTLGCILYNQKNETVGLSNYHVLYGDLGRTGDEIIQPAKVQVSQNDVIGQLLDGSSQYDCAICSLNNSRPGMVGQINGLIGSISGLEAPVFGTFVQKYGMMSGLTFGKIEGVALDGSFTISANPAKPNPNNVVATRGDSGALWVSDTSGTFTAIGLHFKSEGDWIKGYAYDINKVLNKLYLHF